MLIPNSDQIIKNIISQLRRKLPVNIREQIPFEELQSEANLAMVIAVNQFNREFGTKLQDYVTLTIRNYLLKFIDREYKYYVNNQIELTDNIAELENPELNLIKIDIRARINQIKNSLPQLPTENQRRCLSLLIKEPELTLREISERLNITPSNAAKTLKKARQNLAMIISGK